MSKDKTPGRPQIPSSYYFLTANPPLLSWIIDLARKIVSSLPIIAWDENCDFDYKYLRPNFFESHSHVERCQVLAYPFLIDLNNKVLVACKTVSLLRRKSTSPLRMHCELLYVFGLAFQIFGLEGGSCFRMLEKSTFWWIFLALKNKQV